MNDKEKIFEKNMKKLDKLINDFDEVVILWGDEFPKFVSAYFIQQMDEKETKKFIRYAKSIKKDSENRPSFE